MAYTDLLNLKQCSLGYATQSDIVTPAAGSYTYLRAHDFTLQPEAPSSSPGSSVNTRGASSRRRAGRVWYRASFKTVMQGQLSSYAYASGGPTLAGAWGLLTGPFATVAGDYHAAGVTTADGNTVTLVNNPLIGSLIAYGTGSTVAGMGYVMSKSGGGPYTTNLREDIPAAPGSGVKQFPTLTCYPAVGKQPFTLRVTGEPSVQDMRLHGALLRKVTFSFDEADNLVADWEFMVYGGRVPRGGDGGLKAILSYLEMEPFVGAGNGRVVLASNVFTTFNDATADSEGHCDVRDISITYEWVHRPVGLPSLTEGVKDVAIFNPTTEVSFSIPEVVDYEASSVNIFETAFRASSEVGFSLYMGDTPGKLFAHQCPRMQVESFPAFPEVESALGRQVTLRAIDNDGDGASTDGGNKPSFLSVG